MMCFDGPGPSVCAPPLRARLCTPRTRASMTADCQLGDHDRVDIRLTGRIHWTKLEHLIEDIRSAIDVQCKIPHAPQTLSISCSFALGVEAP